MAAARARGRLVGVNSRTAVRAGAVDDNVWLMARFVSGPRGALSSDRYSPAIGEGTDIYGSGGTIHLATEAGNPSYAVSLEPTKELPDVLREANSSTSTCVGKPDRA